MNPFFSHPPQEGCVEGAIYSPSLNREKSVTVPRTLRHRTCHPLEYGKKK